MHVFTTALTSRRELQHSKTQNGAAPNASSNLKVRWLVTRLKKLLATRCPCAVAGRGAKPPLWIWALEDIAPDRDLLGRRGNVLRVDEGTIGPSAARSATEAIVLHQQTAHRATPILTLRSTLIDGADLLRGQQLQV